MAIVVTHKTGGSDNSEPTNTASVDLSGGTPFIAIAASNPLSIIPTLNVSGCGLTWAEHGYIGWEAASRLSVYKGTGTPTTGAITISSTYVLDGVAWAVFTVSGADTFTTPTTNATYAMGAVHTTAGTPATGDVSIAVLALQIDVNINWATEWSEKLDISETTIARFSYAVADPYDTTPSASWDSQERNYAMLSFYAQIGGDSIAPLYMNHSRRRRV